MKSFIAIGLLIISPLFSTAQFDGLLKRVKNKANQKVNQRIDKKVDNALEKSLDEAEGKSTTKENAPVKTTEKNNNTTQENTVTVVSKYDFIPGEKILYTEDFSKEAISELPTGWNTNGSGEVVSINGQPGKWLQLHKSFIYLSANTQDFGENYTIEFDAILKLKNNGWGFPELYAGVLSSSSLSTTDNRLLREPDLNASAALVILPGAASVSRLKIETKIDNKSYFNSQAKEYKELENYYGKPIHVSFQVQKERMRVWVNEVKAFDAPKAIAIDKKMNQLFFRLSYSNYAESDYGIFVSNIKIATGIPDTRHKLMEEGKFSTTGILFDVNAATLKPASNAVLKEIAAVMKDNPAIRINVVGHTSSDGDDNKNLELSKNRAQAVKQALVTDYGIDASRIETDGKGETQPAADNKTKEGQTANRRVEFIKL